MSSALVTSLRDPYTAGRGTLVGIGGRVKLMRVLSPANALHLYHVKIDQNKRK
ncbi:protein of unknown function [Candidatus Methylomirabilis oxygeniifera]|uniref:Uncharacterized protein n=1 Tax=Methylomirabilis oxygeniifera TaxID=671143 RepID=D5MKU3_METO1|nr:protein of unknown function [Candidatus Methylomirabilis oxyfera]